MSKKMFITDCWDRPFRKLEPSLKNAWFYMWLKCDPCGVFEIDEDYWELDLGFAFEKEEIKKAFGEKILFISDTKILLLEYILINYVALKDGYNPHKPVFRALDKNNLKLSPSLDQACLKLEDEDEDEDEDEREEEGEDESKKFGVSKSLKFQTDFKELWKEYFPAQLLAPDDIENINALKRKIADQIKEKKRKEGYIGHNPQNDEILDGIRFILKNLPDFWKDKIDVKKLANNLNSIIQQIISDNGNGKQPNGSNITNSEKARRAALKEIINRAAVGELKMD